MSVFKLYKRNGTIELDSGGLVDITHDPKAKMMPKKLFLSDKYKIEKDTFITKSNNIITIAKNGHSSELGKLRALYFQYLNYHVIILPENAYTFLNGKSIEPIQFSIFNWGSKINQR